MRIWDGAHGSTGDDPWLRYQSPSATKNALRRLAIRASALRTPAVPSVHKKVMHYSLTSHGALTPVSSQGGGPRGNDGYHRLVSIRNASFVHLDARRTDARRTGNALRRCATGGATPHQASLNHEKHETHEKWDARSERQVTGRRSQTIAVSLSCVLCLSWSVPPCSVRVSSMPLHRDVLPLPHRVPAGPVPVERMIDHDKGLFSPKPIITLWPLPEDRRPPRISPTFCRRGRRTERGNNMWIWDRAYGSRGDDPWLRYQASSAKKNALTRLDMRASALRTPAVPSIQKKVMHYSLTSHGESAPLLRANP